MPLIPTPLPGTVLGYVGGKPVRVIAGGSEAAPEGTDDQAGTDTDQGQQQQQPTLEDIAALKEALRKERDKSREGTLAARELAALKASQQTDTEKAIAAAKADAAREVAGKFTQRLAGLSIRAHAGKFNDPGDAVMALQGRLAEFVTDDGDVDDKAVQAAVAEVLKAKPYLAKQDAPKPPDFDGGQRDGASGTTDMNRTIRRMAGVQ